MKKVTDINDLFYASTEYELPAIWASYLVNCDSTGLEQADIDQCDRDTNDLGLCVDVLDNEYFGQYKGIGHTLATFKFRKNMNNEMHTCEYWSEVMKDTTPEQKKSCLDFIIGWMSEVATREKDKPKATEFFKALNHAMGKAVV